MSRYATTPKCLSQQLGPPNATIHWCPACGATMSITPDGWHTNPKALESRVKAHYENEHKTRWKLYRLTGNKRFLV